MNKDRLSVLRWAIIAVFLFVTVISAFWNTPLSIKILPLLTVVTIFSAVILHGKERYGLKNMLVFFAITWVVSHFFEALSIQTGFPFSYYHYEKLAGPRLFEVPLIIMFAYFGMGYASWSISTILLNQFSDRLRGFSIFLVPFIAAFIMVMWDLCMDPWASTVDGLWVWTTPGSYFGVPLQNYFGWFMVVYIIFQLFALYIARFERDLFTQPLIFSKKSFWLEPVAIYGIESLTQLLDPLGVSEHMNIFGPMALVTIFTMVFVTLLAGIKIKDTVELS